VARDRGIAFQAAFGVANAHLLFTREAYPSSAYELLAGLAGPARRASEGSPATRSNLPEGVAIGDPDWIVEQVKGWESIGVDGINFLTNGLETLSQDEVLTSMRLFASEVMPKFR
jgi:alkanesulfonate monooxygenase SsuD/methylene tetrahydromethanopterin reductase-like flavin-dependent oxidoreductase (luciferase family)